MMPIRDNGCYCFTLETIDTVDLFIKPMYKQMIVHSLNHFIDTKGLVVYGWLLMSNKLYMICQAQPGQSLSVLRKEFARFTCNKIIDTVKDDDNTRNQWLLKHFEKPTLFDESTSAACWGDIKTTAQIDINTPESMAMQLDFIHGIPVKERIVHYGSDYIYSSARDYADMPGLVKITKLAPVEQEIDEIENRRQGFRKKYK